MKYLFLSLILFFQVPLFAASNSAWSKTGFEVNAKAGLPYATEIGLEYYLENWLLEFWFGNGRYQREDFAS